MGKMNDKIDKPEGEALGHPPRGKVAPKQMEKILEAHRKWVESEGNEGQRAILSAANLDYADLSSADLAGADLSGASLFSAKLPEANLAKADLTKADLGSADLMFADLAGAILKGAALSEAELGGADLNKADLSEAYLYNASLFAANLLGADLTKADLSEANAVQANFREANLTKTRFSSTDIEGASLENARGHVPPQVMGAKNWRLAFYSDDFRKQLGLPQGHNQRVEEEVVLIGSQWRDPEGRLDHTLGGPYAREKPERKPEALTGMEEGAIQVGVRVGGRMYGNEDFPVGKIDVQRHGSLVMVRIEPAQQYSGGVEYSEMFMNTYVAFELFQLLRNALGTNLTNLVEREGEPAAFGRFRARYKLRQMFKEIFRLRRNKKEGK